MKINKLVILLLIVGMPFSILNSEFELSSSDVIFYNVSLAGAVDNPGIYTVPPSTRVSSVLKIARKKPPQVIDNIDLEESSQEEVDLVKKRYENYYKEEDEIINSFNGSRRNIILKRGEEEITIDLLRFFRLGDINNNPYVMDGDIIVTRNAGGDEYVTLDHLKPGDIAGAMGFIDGKKHSATLRAVKDAHVLKLQRDELEAMLEEHPRLVYKIMKMIVRSVHKTLVRMNRQFVEMNNYIMKEHGRY